MDVKHFKMTNIGQFAQSELPLAPTANKPSNITVLVGNNGSGKTAILTAMSLSLSWLIAAFFDPEKTGNHIAGTHIKKGQTSGSLDIEITATANQNETFHWALVKTLDGSVPSTQNTLADAAKLAHIYQTAFSKDNAASFPLIAFYNAERYVRNMALDIKKTPTGDQLAGFENALGHTASFEQFFEWFREREDIENESASPLQLTSELAFDSVMAAMKAAKVEITDKKVRTIAAKMVADQQSASNDKQLLAVRNAIQAFMPGLSNFRVRRSPILHMSVEKAGITLSVDQLSQGEKVLMALIGDIARRLAILNPSLDNPLQGDGIVLIDEADLHLHPQWQRTFIARLRQTFPHCQFVLTTHSPLMISDSKDVLCYLLDNGELTELDNLYGLDANQVLLKVMDTDIRNAAVEEQFNALLDHLQEGRIEPAKSIFNALSLELPVDEIELVNAEMMIRKWELSHAKNNKET